MDGAAPRTTTTEVVYMPGAPCLYRRASGVYAVRLAVPARLRLLLGKGELHSSTGSKDWATAKLVALRILFDWRQHFMILDIDRLAVSSPLLQDDGLLSIPDAAKAIGLPESALLSELMAEGADLCTQAQHWPGWQVRDLHEIDRDHDGAFVLNDVEQQGERVICTAPVRAYNTAATVAALLAASASQESLFRLTGSAAFWPDEPQEIPQSAWMTPKRAVEAIRARLAMGIRPEHRKPAVAAPVAAPAAPTGAKHGERRFSELLAHYLDRRTPKAEEADRLQSEVNLFIELMGDIPMNELSIDTIDQYYDELLRVPDNRALAARRHKCGDIRELQAIAKRDGLPTKGPEAAKRHIGKLSPILTFGVRLEYLLKNPAASHGMTLKRSSGKRDQDARAVFDEADLARIFGVEWFRDGKGHFSSTGNTYWRPFQYWLPLLAILTGARLRELCQLKLSDIRKSGSGVAYIKIDADADDKSLKNTISERELPLHEKLIEFGILDYANTLRKAGHDRLFPELRYSQKKGYTELSESWFNEKFLGKRLKIARDGKKTFHSFRHTLADHFKNVMKLTEGDAAVIFGHKRGEGMTYGRYGKDATVDQIKPTIDEADFPCLSGIKPINIRAAMNALDIALELKAANARR